MKFRSALCYLLIACLSLSSMMQAAHKHAPENTPVAVFQTAIAPQHVNDDTNIGVASAANHETPSSEHNKCDLCLAWMQAHSWLVASHYVMDVAVEVMDRHLPDLITHSYRFSALHRHGSRAPPYSLS